MRDLPGLRHLRQLLLATFVTTSVLGSCFAVPAIALPRETAHASRNTGHKPSAVSKRREELRRKALKKPTLALDSSFIRKAQAAGSVLPFTIRLRRPYEAGPGDDVLQLAWDPRATRWPLAGTNPAATPTLNLDGALTYEWDYSADTSGYATLGTVETIIGGGVSMTGTGFPIAVPEGLTCSTWQSLKATAVSFTPAGVRFGTVNPFSRQVSGTIDVRTTIRTQPTRCTGPTIPATAVATTAAPDPPLPVAFTGSFTVSPSVTADGMIRLGILRVADTTQTPQRSVFGLVHACTDPAAADGCARQAFPVRTKLLSLTAEVLAGDKMPGPPAAP
jgi:hypothetical protein